MYDIACSGVGEMFESLLHDIKGRLERQGSIIHHNLPGCFRFISGLGG